METYAAVGRTIAEAMQLLMPKTYSEEIPASTVKEIKQQVGMVIVIPLYPHSLAAGTPSNSFSRADISILIYRRI